MITDNTDNAERKTDQKTDSTADTDQQHRPKRTSTAQMRGLGLWFWLAAVFLAVIVAGGAVAYFAADDNDTNGGQIPATGAPQTERPDWGLPFTDELGRRVEVPPTPDGVAAAQDTAAAAPARDLTAAPGGVQWQQIRGFPLPFSATDGPTRIDGRMAAGFAQTPRGAALAGLQLYTRAGATNAGAAEFYADRVIPDSEPLEQLRREFLRRAQEAVTGGEGDKLALMPFFRVDAYRVTQWNPDRPDYAVVDYALLKESRTGWISKRMELLWRDGDWQVKLTADLFGGQKEISNIGGWTQWPAS